MIHFIRSGGQTGVDRAALDAAIQAGIDCGGWCPRGRFAEDGTIPAAYPLVESANPDYAERTLWNVRDADGTLILAWGAPEGGTALTRVFAMKEDKPYLVLDLAADARVEEALQWIRAHGVRTLNVAGPRESSVPGIYAHARAFLDTLLAEAQSQG